MEEAVAGSVKDLRYYYWRSYQAELDDFVSKANIDLGVSNPTDWFTPWEEYWEQQYQHSNEARTAWFCQWLRKEAKICKVPIPDPPAEPKKRKKS